VRVLPFFPHKLPAFLLLSFTRFYGINLNQNVVLQQIGFDGKSGTAWDKLFNISVGGIIITALGFVPGKPS
jgi:hypothetical protein